ncbi:FAD binding domain-containing protein [Colletotrichum higginsianum]|uniref:FAD binding domain-containing protein n=2 Tax=Colletotrichum higginsianum TaxID=80884 RepID=H1UZ86_COLHI|nr:FAD binding domain-containing protein [Colletotrichum higginsianum IMI 349063]OBR07997.1 FAD binding domain-containing protein [Colletotrichum higginsianum IMI 349063]CCF33287.1 FAD binding domain-containing protein [Colletotrichum higginsianum]
MISTLAIGIAFLFLGARASPVRSTVSTNSLLQRNPSLAVGTGYKSCDALVAAGLETAVFFPPDAEYEASITSYYSIAVQQLRPWCIVRPETSDQVSRALTALVTFSPAGSWDIAVRGGGHSHFASNNVANGVTIDLSRMNSTVYNVDSQIAAIGPGSRWGSVYSEVEKYGRSLTGGRLGGVGVSGLVLGGGISFHTGTRGFSCDGIRNFEVVLSNGSIANANEGENADLFKALKGGSSNFGIVTRFDMETFEAAPGGLYGGGLLYAYEHKMAILNQLVRVTDVNHEHPEDAMPVAFISSGSGPTTISVNTVNTLGNENSTSFAPLAAIPNIGDTRKRLSYGQLITAAPDNGGERTVWFSICFQNKMEVLTKLMDLYDAFVEDLGQAIPEGNLTIQFILQPLPKHYSQPKRAGGGGNVLGLEKTLTQNSIIYNAIVKVQTVEQEALARTRLAALVANLEAFADLNDASTPWRFLNYVNPAQDPIKSYGEENVKFLKEVAAKYDPQGIFQTRVSGGFKLSRVS